MKRNFVGTMVGIDDKPLMEQSFDDEGKPHLNEDGRPKMKQIELSAVIANALLMKKQGEDLGIEEQTKRYKLAKRVRRGGMQEITSEEATLIKKQVATHMPIVVVGVVDEFLETDPAVTE